MRVLRFALMTSSDHRTQRSWIVWAGLILLTLVAGCAIPGQGRINAALASETGDAYFAAATSVSAGLLLMLVVALLTRPGRGTLRAVGPAFRRGDVRWWHLLAGCAGGYFVLTQTLTIGMIGVAVFTVAMVTGLTVGGLLWDRIGLGPGGRKRLNIFRIAGAVITVLAVIWAVSPQLEVTDQGWAWLLLVLLPFSGGFLNAGQQALNGRQTSAYGSPIPATLFNFIFGTLVLLLAWGVKLLVAGPMPAAPPTEWWFYIGGPLGCVLIGLGAVLVTKVGVLLTAMGMIAGQLIGSLLLDLILPAPGSLVTTATVLGTLLTLVAVVVASVPDMRRGRCTSDHGSHCGTAAHESRSTTKMC